MLVRVGRYRSVPPTLLDLDDVAGMLDYAEIPGRALVEIVLHAGDGLMFGEAAGALLPQPLGAGRTRRLRLSPGNVAQADGIRYGKVVLHWPHLRAALVAAGVRGADRLPTNPAPVIPGLGEVPLSVLRAAPRWWDDAGAEAADRAQAPVPSRRAEQTDPDTESSTPPAERIAARKNPRGPVAGETNQAKQQREALYPEIRDARQEGESWTQRSPQVGQIGGAHITRRGQRLMRRRSKRSPGSAQGCTANSGKLRSKQQDTTTKPKTSFC